MVPFQLALASEAWPAGAMVTDSFATAARDGTNETSPSKTTETASKTPENEILSIAEELHPPAKIINPAGSGAKTSASVPNTRDQTPMSTLGSDTSAETGSPTSDNQ